MRLDTLLLRAARRLSESGSPSPRLDADVLLCHVMQVERSWLYTWGDRQAEPWVQARFEALIAARAQGWPVAYLTEEREFWGLRLMTGPSTLIPRPDTERLVEAALAQADSESGRFLDLGTGTGAVALAFACERPTWEVVAVDREPAAVALAKANAQRHGLTRVEILISDWFEALGKRQFAIIVSNPPYLASDDPHLALGDVRFEPRSALVAGKQGLADLEALVDTARDQLEPHGWLMLEHGMQQGAAVRSALEAAGYEQIETVCDLEGRDRVTLGRWPATTER
ncbi:peptide chain release factor N(5)-glutamine methyltransferase [Litchfieldella xinjiangensis]|uniref:peptide chain release factor N(5)-glutamine methyltransferase n=1 Tax=Litchfieldella xinjiangensis TaxID=1166948 RepID=UPI0005BC99A3|nr:peptide chain release factor N(5)-glutamine methyltransferase [Halomonas xinjiangensis]